MNTIFDRVKHILVERFAVDPAKVQLDSQLQAGLNLDSVDAIDLLMAIDEAFGIRIPEGMLKDIHTVGDLVAVVEKHSRKIPQSPPLKKGD